MNQLLFVGEAVFVEDEKNLQSVEFRRACNRRKLKGKVMKCSWEGGLRGANIVLNGERVTQVEMF